MAALSERKIEIVRTLVEAAPDRVVGGLQAALAETAPDSALGRVRGLVEAEVRERSLRNTILLPIAPMCVGEVPHRLTFPPRALAQIWRGLRADYDETIERARVALEEQAPAHEVTALLDELSAAAAAGLRAGDRPAFQAAAEACEQTRAGSAERG